MTLDDLAELDLAYAPPYSSANDPVNLAAFVGRERPLRLQPARHRGRSSRPSWPRPTPPLVLDVRTLGEWAAGPPARARCTCRWTSCASSWRRLPRDRRIVVYCRSGFRAHLAVRILKENGFADVANVTGGWVSLEAEGGFDVSR